MSNKRRFFSALKPKNVACNATQILGIFPSSKSSIGVCYLCNITIQCKTGPQAVHIGFVLSIPSTCQYYSSLQLHRSFFKPIPSGSTRKYSLNPCLWFIHQINEVNVSQNNSSQWDREMTLRLKIFNYTFTTTIHSEPLWNSRPNSYT